MKRTLPTWIPVLACLAGLLDIACSGSGDTGLLPPIDAGADSQGSGATGSHAGGSAGSNGSGTGGRGTNSSGGTSANSGGNGSGAISGGGGSSGTSAGGGGGASGASTSGGTGNSSGGVSNAGGSVNAGGNGQGGIGNSGGSSAGGGSPIDSGTDGSTGARDGGTSSAGGAGGAGTADAGKPCSVDGDCDDQSYCTGVEKCVAGHCTAGTPVDCPDDGFSCTVEFCNDSTKQCERVAEDTACADNTVCNGAEKCEPTNTNANQTTGCIAGVALNCVDAFACTSDTCDAVSGCVHTPNDAACSNQNACDGIETCNPFAGCQAGSAPAPCDDGIVCTTDTCDPQTGFCVFKAVDSKCSDGLFCNGDERCDPLTGCIAGTPVACLNADGIACTEEKCDEALDTCPLKGVPNHSLCPTGDVCDPTNGCIPGKSCTTSAQCSDGLYCTGAETCVSGICQGGTPVDCDDGIDCTVDSCDETADACKHVASNALCDDKNVCNGTETCNATKGCQFGTDLVCPDDGFSCTTETCVPGQGCASVPFDSACNDNKMCDGVERCAPKSPGHNATTGCLAGTPVVCPQDNIACTTALCDDTVNGCVTKTDDNACACGETCDAITGCGKHCTVRACAGKVYECGDCSDNDGDCKIDSNDQSCLGACQNNEAGFKGDIPGQNSAPCKADCYFDNDTGSGNDDCYWTHECDPHEVATAYDPEGQKCAYDTNAKVPGSSGSCTDHQTSQSTTCHTICGPLTPNGCDCFGCCSIPGAPTTVYLGSEDAGGNGTCNLATVGDPTKCRPCLQVDACLNRCDHCELCVGKPTLPPDCTSQQCPPGAQPCGLATDPPCGDGQYCVTGCCQNLL